ncbi:prolipoprotein diacylglyceryl transferase [Roseiconus nitratireducens]|nr:prolipoprotein diacylglyceryl transferase family protein [Roseiconus nitratireducens]
MDLSIPHLYPLYALPVLLALLVGMWFPVTGHLRDQQLKRQYYRVQLVTFVSAVLGAKLTFLFGEFLWPLRPLDSWEQVVYSGRSIVGALIFGLLGAELAKPFFRYPLPPNDRFAAQLPFAFAIGRLGCLFSGCCRGTPFESPWSVTYSDGIARHPAPLYEILFQLLAGCVALWLVKKQRLSGCVFSVYLMAYGSFRFFSEFLRETPKPMGSLSGYQWLSILMVVLGGIFYRRNLLRRERDRQTNDLSDPTVATSL